MNESISSAMKVDMNWETLLLLTMLRTVIGKMQKNSQFRSTLVTAHRNKDEKAHKKCKKYMQKKTSHFWKSLLY